MIGREGTLGIGQPLGHARGLARQGETPRVRRAELRMAADGLLGQGVEPPPHRAQLAGVETAQRGLGHHVAGVLEIVRSERMGDRLVVIAPRLVPRRGARVQPGDLAGMEDPQAGPEDLREQRVVAIPGPLVVERDDQQVGALQLLQAPLAVRLARDGVAQRPAQAVEDRRAHEEVLGLGRQPGKDLLDDVVEDEAVGRPEPPHQLGLVGRPRRETAARRNAAAQPSVRSVSSSTSAG